MIVSDPYQVKKMADLLIGVTSIDLPSSALISVFPDPLKTFLILRMLNRGQIEVKIIVTVQHWISKAITSRYP